MTGDVISWTIQDRALAALYAALTTALLYDHITTFDVEVEIVWNRRKWTIVHFLFIFNRYVGDVALLMNAVVFVRHIDYNTFDGCELAANLRGWLSIAVLWSMQGLTIFRISTMYLHTRKIKILLSTAFAIQAALLIFVTLLSSKSTTPTPSPPGFRLCTHASTPTYYFITWIPIVVYEAFIVFLAALVGLRRYRTILSPSVLGGLPARDTLAYILLRDSILYPFVAFLVALANLITWYRYPILVRQMTTALGPFTAGILGCRLLLNLQKAFYQPFQHELNLTKPSTSTTVSSAEAHRSNGNSSIGSRSSVLFSSIAHPDK